MMRFVFSTLTHFAAELRQIWLPPPDLSHFYAMPSESCYDPRRAGLTRDDWRIVMHAESRCDSGVLPWLQNYLATGDSDGSSLIDAIMSHLSLCRENNSQYLSFYDDEYPNALRNLVDSPVGLTVTGNVRQLNRTAVSIVGSRKASGAAMRFAFDAGKRAAERGIVVVSGGAFGCDIAAHQGVLSTVGLDERGNWAGLPAVIVFAGGLSATYPTRNQWAFRRILEQEGAWVSEKHWLRPAFPSDFPVRNRIIAGLGGTTLLVEAPLKSGAMHTVRVALDNGREVVVWRGQRDDARAEGNYSLMESGACAVSGIEEWDEILTFVGQDYPNACNHSYNVAKSIDKNISKIDFGRP